MENIKLFQLSDEEGWIGNYFGVIDYERRVLYITDEHGNFLEHKINLRFIKECKVIQQPTEDDLLSMW